VTELSPELTALSVSDVRALFREIDQEAAAEQTAATPTTPEPDRGSEEKPARPSPLDEAREALRAEEAERETAEAARALLRKRAAEQGFNPDGFGSNLTDQEVKQAVGLAEKPLTAEQRRIQREDAIANDPEAVAAELRRRDVLRLSEKWFSLAKYQRQEECTRLGLDYAATEAKKQAEMKARWS
jgi:hypothetical protein